MKKFKLKILFPQKIFQKLYKIKIKSYNESNFSINKEENSLINLNNALSNNGLFLEVVDNYRFEKAIIIYNVFTEDLKDNLLNNKNKIILEIGKHSNSISNMEVEEAAGAQPVAETSGLQVTVTYCDIPEPLLKKQLE